MTRQTPKNTTLAITLQFPANNFNESDRIPMHLCFRHFYTKDFHCTFYLSNQTPRYKRPLQWILHLGRSQVTGVEDSKITIMVHGHNTQILFRHNNNEFKQKISGAFRKHLYPELYFFLPFKYSYISKFNLLMACEIYRWSEIENLHFSFQ